MHGTAPSSPTHTPTCMHTIIQHKMSTVLRQRNPGAERGTLVQQRQKSLSSRVNRLLISYATLDKLQFVRAFSLARIGLRSTLNVADGSEQAKLYKVPGSRKEPGEISFSSLPYSLFLIPVPRATDGKFFLRETPSSFFFLCLRNCWRARLPVKNAFYLPGTSIACVPNEMHY